MFHTLIIIGNLGREPEMRYTPGGQAVTSLNIATNRTYKGADGQPVKETVWFRVSVWGKQAETTNQYLRTGSKVLVEGRLTPDKATGSPRIFQKADGSHSASYEVTATNVQFLSSKGEDDREPEWPGGEDVPF